MLEVCVNKAHYDNNSNETGVNINSMNGVERTFSYITSLDLTV